MESNVWLIASGQVREEQGTLESAVLKLSQTSAIHHVERSKDSFTEKVGDEIENDRAT